MDVNTSEIVAMVSLPDFDPNRRDRISEDAIFNRATLGVYEMGSTFKIFNTAMALDYGTTTMHNGYDAKQSRSELPASPSMTITVRAVGSRCRKSSCIPPISAP